jgi:hypothetical protein
MFLHAAACIKGMDFREELLVAPHADPNRQSAELSFIRSIRRFFLVHELGMVIPWASF